MNMLCSRCIKSTVSEDSLVVAAIFLELSKCVVTPGNFFFMVTRGDRRVGGVSFAANFEDLFLFVTTFSDSLSVSLSSSLCLGGVDKRDAINESFSAVFLEAAAGAAVAAAAGVAGGGFFGFEATFFLIGGGGILRFPFPFGILIFDNTTMDYHVTFVVLLSSYCQGLNVSEKLLGNHGACKHVAVYLFASYNLYTLLQVEFIYTCYAQGKELFDVIVHVFSTCKFYRGNRNK